MDLREFLENLKEAEGTLSVSAGVAHFESGQAFDLNEDPAVAALLGAGNEASA